MATLWAGQVANASPGPLLWLQLEEPLRVRGERAGAAVWEVVASLLPWAWKPALSWALRVKFPTLPGAFGDACGSLERGTAPGRSSLALASRPRLGKARAGAAKGPVALSAEGQPASGLGPFSLSGLVQDWGGEELEASWGRPATEGVTACTITAKTRCFWVCGGFFSSSAFQQYCLLGEKPELVPRPGVLEPLGVNSGELLSSCPFLGAQAQSAPEAK